MKFSHPDARCFVPDGLAPEAALARVTHLGIGAHQDDLEFMAFHGIAACYESDAEWFGGVTCTDGAGSPRTGPFAHLDDAEMRAVRRWEQDRAAQLGRYGVMIQLGHPSAAVKEPKSCELRDDLLTILRVIRPRVVYTHNLADKHDTHVAVAVAAIAALRALPPEDQPGVVYGCEVWRGLDWLADADKIVQDVSGHDALAAALCAVFASQVEGGKRYDLAVEGRRRANATFLEAHAADGASSVAFAMDLTPLVRDPLLHPDDYVETLLARFRVDMVTKLKARTTHL